MNVVLDIFIGLAIGFVIAFAIAGVAKVTFDRQWKRGDFDPPRWRR